MTVQFRPPPALVELTRALEGAGFETWAVGGAIRDTLLGGEPTEWDLATRARPDQVRGLFKRTVPVGVQHGTVGVFGSDRVLYEVTTFRLDVIPMGRKAVVSFADSLDEDLARRDFTINAIAWHPLRDELRDPFGGTSDLDSGVLRAVGAADERFREDYLRILRGLRFAGRLALSIDPATWQYIVAEASGLSGLSPERVREELLKVMVAPAPSRSLALYERAGVFPQVAPALGEPLAAAALESIDRVAAHRPLLRVGLLLLHGMKHPDPKGAEQLLSALRFSNAEIQAASKMVEGGLAPPESWASGLDRRRWMARLGRRWIRNSIRVWIAGLEPGSQRSEAVPPIRAIRRDLTGGIPLDPRELLVSGKDLIRAGFEPGPDMGRLLDYLLVSVWEDPGVGSAESLLQLARRYRGG
ncbi:MAG: CCA tRNA nucleotidyltransferase [Longimicrobiales bacterium]